eukprot:SAG31_NODE_39025_length_291_cov_1.067708_1_plen_71_part_01
MATDITAALFLRVTLTARARAIYPVNAHKIVAVYLTLRCIPASNATEALHSSLLGKHLTNNFFLLVTGHPI